MPGFLQNAVWRIESALYGGYLAACRALGLKRAAGWSGAIARAIGPHTATDRVARVNLQIAFPHRDAQWRDETMTRVWDGIGRSFGEFAHLRDMPVYQDGSRIEVSGAERLDAVAASGKGAVFISGHFANWEVMAMAIVQRGVDCAITYRAANNPWFDAQVKRVRRSYGVDTLTPKAGPKGARALLDHLKSGRSVALMNDQKFNKGVAAQFFGHEAMTAPGPARLAIRAGVPLIPMSAVRLPDSRFRVTVHPPIPVDPEAGRTDAVQDAVARINAFLEERIREAPEDWFWVHRRFDKAVYRNNRPAKSANMS